MRVVFMGTPEFAVGTLEAIAPICELVGIVTVPDKPAGRGLKVSQSDVKKWADAHQVPTLQPVKLKDAEFLNELQSWNADLFVVVAFRMLPKEVYTMPVKGCFNVHASLLPQYRGAAPINHAIINGEKETGVTTFFLNHEIDTGDIILQKKTEIAPNENVGDLYARLMKLGGEAAVETIQHIENGTLKTTPQTSAGIYPAPKIFKENTRIKWDQKAEVIHNFVRGLAPYPGAYTEIKDKEGKTCSIKIFEIDFLGNSELPAGTIEVKPKQGLMIHTADKLIKVLDLQFQGKARMKAEQFLNGFRFENYDNKL